MKCNVIPAVAVVYFQHLANICDAGGDERAEHLECESHIAIANRLDESGDPIVFFNGPLNKRQKVSYILAAARLARVSGIRLLRFEFGKSVIDPAVDHPPEMRGRGFFYFRDSEFMKDVPPEKKKDYECESKESGIKLTKLKNDIRASHNTIYENYPCVWDKNAVSPEDGSKGTKGFVSDLLKRLILSESGVSNGAIYACGPFAMLREIARLAEKSNTPCQVSMEERMACGVGACLGCPVKMKAKNGYKMVCKDGPVFQSREIDWNYAA